MLSSRERLLTALDHEEPDRVPIFFGTSGVTSMLAPAFSLSRVRRRPELRDQLVAEGSPWRRVPRAPRGVNAACASAL